MYINQNNNNKDSYNSIVEGQKDRKLFDFYFKKKKGGDIYQKEIGIGCLILREIFRDL